MENYIFVEYLNNINDVVKRTFQSMQRIKLLCFDSSPSFLVFGASSGGIYIFQRDPCKFLKLIPSKDGSANLIAISKDEKHIGIASSRGLVLIFENFIDEFNGQYQVFSEHEGTNITCIKWHGKELYAGDDCGKVSVVSIFTALFQIPSASLMTLDSSIVQIDAYQNYLLISTRTKTFLCDTEKEHFIQIGKKLRDGCFGACFCGTAKDTFTPATISVTQNAFKTIKQEDLISAAADNSNSVTKIYCARPGARLWEVGLTAKVLVTYQFKNCLLTETPPTDLVIIGCEEESVLAKRNLPQNERVPDNFSFQRIFSVCDRFILTFRLSCLYVFDPSSSKLIFWTKFCSPIKHIAFVNNVIYIWKSNLEINLLSVSELEHVVLGALYKKQYYLCAELCVEFQSNLLQILNDSSKKLYLLSALKTKVSSNELLEKLSPVLQKINQEVHAKHQAKNNKVVVVENLKLTNVGPTRALDENKQDLKLVLKQYKLNKTHETVDIPEVTRFLETTESLFVFLTKFNDYVARELEEDSTQWSQEQYLKHILKKTPNLSSLTEENVEFLTTSVISANSSVKFSCSCGYPLPKARRFKPKHFDVAFNLLNARKNEKELLEHIPYLWRYKGKTEIYGVNMTLLVQYSDLELFRGLTLNFKYDNWHDILGYFTKINSKGLCLNCDNKIDVDGLLKWTDVAKVILQSIGAKSTLRILEKYHKVIPNGALDAHFYQTCIFAHSFNSDNSSTGVEPEASVNFVNALDKANYAQFQQAMERYLQRKYNEKKSPSFVFLPENMGTCLLCNLPLKNDILFESENSLVCGHKFHKFCYERNCNVCVCVAK